MLAGMRVVDQSDTAHRSSRAGSFHRALRADGEPATAELLVADQHTHKLPSLPILPAVRIEVMIFLPLVQRNKETHTNQGSVILALKDVTENRFLARVLLRHHFPGILRFAAVVAQNVLIVEIQG